MDVALATCAAFPDLGPQDRGLLPALQALGLQAQPVVWNDPRFDWSRPRAVVVQSAWDSHHHPEAFAAWAGRVAEAGALFNPAPVLRWNLHKGYLRELEARGVAVTPTVWVPRGQSVALAELARARGWQRLVAKPAISAAAEGTHVLAPAEASSQASVDALLASHDVMLQPYLEAFATEGERSYVYIDGRFSHALRRPPTLRTADRGFTEVVPFEPEDTAEIALAESVLRAVEDPLLYARVDVATNNDGVVRLQELELIEPSLFLDLVPGAAQRLAQAIAARLPG